MPSALAEVRSPRFIVAYEWKVKESVGADVLGGPQPQSDANRVVGRLRAAEDVRPYRGRASRVPNGGVKVVWFGTDRRLSLAQNPVVRGIMARPLVAVEMRLWSAAVLSF